MGACGSPHCVVALLDTVISTSVVCTRPLKYEENQSFRQNLFGPTKNLDKICLCQIFNLSSVGALRHARIFVNHKCQSHGNKHHHVHAVPTENVLAIGLYRLAHGGSFDNAGIAMNVGKATACEAFTDVVNALYNFRSYFIKFPTNEAETRI